VDGKPVQAWCDDYTPAEFEAGGLAMIRAKYGAGDFLVCLYGMLPGTKRFTIRARSEIHVDASASMASPVSPQNDAMRMILDGQAAMLKALTERPALDPTAEMMKTLSLMSAMRDAMGINSTPQKSSVGELVDAIKELRGASDLIASPRESENDDSLMGIVKTMLPAISEMVKTRAQAGASPLTLLPISVPNSIAGAHPGAVPSVNPDEPFPMPANDAGPAPGQPPESDEMPLASDALTAFKLRAYVASLCMMARTKMATDKGAALVYEKMPEEWIDMLDLPNWWEMFIIAVPDAKDHFAWFAEVRDKVLAMLAEDAAEDAKGDAGTPP
jgi:hypothetical protein